MKLHYFKDLAGNFGDDLNPWLWSRLIPDLLDDREDELLVGIGTLLNHRLPPHPLKHVMGSGLGYGELPVVDDRFVFHAVRGFETARALNLPAQKVITDAAVLVRTIATSWEPQKSARYGFMPTGESIRNYDWKAICDELGFRYISCHWAVDRVLAEMGRCETLLTEAMHGAIVADALRLPWLPIRCNEGVLAFKWVDWLSSLRLPYEPSRITPLYDLERDASLQDRFKNRVKRSLKSSGVWAATWGVAPPCRSTSSDRDRAVLDLLNATRRSPFLSAEPLIEQHTERFLGVLERLRTQRTPAGAAHRQEAT